MDGNLKDAYSIITLMKKYMSRNFCDYAVSKELKITMHYEVYKNWGI